MLSWLNRRVPNGTHGGVRGREIYLNFPPTRLSLEEVEDVNKVILLRIAKQQKEVENGDITFKKSVRLSRECYVLLRLARKIKTEEHRTYRNGTCYEFEVALDKDELKLFKEMFGEKVK